MVTIALTLFDFLVLLLFSSLYYCSHRSV